MSNLLWFNEDNHIVHPDSPRGSGGPGAFRAAGPALNDVDIFVSAPHPHSPVGRLFVLNDHHKRQVTDHAGRGKTAVHAGPGSGGEINLYGVFKPFPEWSNDAKVLTAINSNRDDWYPGTPELLAFAKSGSGTVSGVVNIWNVFCAIARNRPKRINIFTHAKDGYIALSGKVVKGDVEFASAENTSLDDELMLKADDNGFTFSDDKTKNVTFPQVRAALGNDAVMVIYGCHAGLDKPYLGRIANILGVRVLGFTDEIRYHPVTKGKRIVGWKYSVGDSEKVSDFHQLDKFAITLTPDVRP